MVPCWQKTNPFGIYWLRGWKLISDSTSSRKFSPSRQVKATCGAPDQAEICASDPVICSLGGSQNQRKAKKKQKPQQQMTKCFFHLRGSDVLVCVRTHVCVSQVFLDGAAGLLPISNQPRWIKAGEAEALGDSAAAGGATTMLLSMFDERVWWACSVCQSGGWAVPFWGKGGGAWIQPIVGGRKTKRLVLSFCSTWWNLPPAEPLQPWPSCSRDAGWTNHIDAGKQFDWIGSVTTLEWKNVAPALL